MPQQQVELKPILQNTNVKAYGVKVYRYLFSPKDKPTRNGYSKKHIVQAWKQLKEKIEKDEQPKYYVQVLYLSGKLGKWIASNWTQLTKNEPVLIEKYEVETYFKSFIFNIMKNPKRQPAGGNDSINNDCLFDAIMNGLKYNFELLPKSMRYASQWKKSLKLDRNDKIPFSMIPTLEEKLKIKINVVGDHNYTSVYESFHEVTIKLKNEHYTYVEQRSKDILKAVKINDKIKESKKLYVYTDHKNIFDGSKMFSLPENEFLTMIKNKRFSNISLMNVPTGEKHKEYHEKIINNCNLVKQLSENKIDLSKMNYSEKDTVKKMIFHELKGIVQPEEMDIVEEGHISRATQGGLMFSCEEKTTFDKAFMIDINSMYPSIMNNSSFKFPIVKPTYEKLDKLPEFLSYGIYRCVVHRSGDEKIDRWFKFSSFNEYTHISLNHALFLGLKVELIQDDQANAILYKGARDRVLSKHYFGKTIDYLYEMKKQHSKETRSFKNMLNLIWGSLCEKNYIKKNTLDGDIDCEDNDLISIKPSENCNKVKMLSSEKIFLYPFARIQPFLLSYARFEMCKQLFKLNDKIIRVHTDSALLITDVKDLFETSDKMGCWKIENEGSCIVKGMKKVEFL